MKFRDFIPDSTESKAFIFSSTTHEDLSNALEKANDWTSRNDIKLINVETVVLPELSKKEGTTDTHLTTSGDMMNSWYQFIRVWYQVD